MTTETQFNLEFLEVWGQKIYAILERNNEDTAKNMRSIEELKDNCNICSRRIEQSVFEEAERRKLSVQELRHYIETEVIKEGSKRANADKDQTHETNLIKAKMAMWGALGGTLMSILANIAIKLIFG